MRRLSYLGRDLSGATAVEFALVGPMFAYLMIGLTVYGGWFWMAQGAQSLAAEGARAAIAGLDHEERERLAREAVASGLAGAAVLDPEHVGVEVATLGSEIRVTVTYPASKHALMALAGLVPAPPGTITRVASVRLGGY